MKKQKISFILKKVKKLLGYEGEYWTKGCLARDKFKRPVNYKDKDAVSFCLLGAIFKTCEEIERPYWDVVCFLEHRLPTVWRNSILREKETITPLAEWNNHWNVDFTDVEDFLDRMIRETENGFSCKENKTKKPERTQRPVGISRREMEIPLYYY